MNRILPVALFALLLSTRLFSQCSPQGNQTSYGTNNVWRGYMYNNTNFGSYRGYVTEGTASSPNFDQDFGGTNVNFPTYNCFVNTETFSARYKLTKTFTNGTYDFTVGGDDGYRFSLDGGSTWVINQWNEQSYNTTTYTVNLNGTYNMVLEYYDNTNDNRLSFSVAPSCTGGENTATYGASDTWRGYIYDGTNFNIYKGMVTEGISGNPSFTQDFGGSNTTFATSGCGVNTETFSVRYRLTKNFTYGNHTFIVGGDDGYRFSLDGGSTWVINQWSDHSYQTTTYSAVFSGTRDMVLEFYENGGDNRISFTTQFNIPLPVKLLSFTGKEHDKLAELNWDITQDSDPDYFEVQKSNDGNSFTDIATIPGPAGRQLAASVAYQYSDPALLTGGASFYRLKMTDISGTVTYSKIVLISTAVVARNEIKIFPTLVTDNNINLKTGSSLKQAFFEIFDFTGKLLLSQQIPVTAAGQTINIPLSNRNLAKGMFLVRIKEAGVPVCTQKIIVQ